MWRTPKSITLRTSLLFTLLAAAVILTMGLFVKASVRHHFVEQDRHALTSELELIRYFLHNAQNGDSEAIRRQLTDALMGHHELSLRVWDATGRSLFSVGHAQVPNDYLMLSQDPSKASIIESPGYCGLSVNIPHGATGEPWIVGMIIDTQHHSQFLKAFQRELVSIGAGGLLLMAGLGWLATRRGLKPIQHMTLVATAISAQRIHHRILAAEVATELAPLALAFNEMLDRLETSFKRLSEFSSDLAHELRTPINNLMTQTQVSLVKPRTVTEYQEIMYSNLEEFERLARMISDMLFLAKADNGLIVPRPTVVDLHSEAQAVCDFYEALAAEKSIVFSLQGSSCVEGDPLMLRRAISNLVSNAVRYSDAGSTISLQLITSSTEACLSVENTGSPVSVEQLSHLFDRFYRADTTRRHQEEGTGLGLPITRSIARAHRGDVTAEVYGDKTRFILHLPLHLSAAPCPVKEE